VLFDQLDAGSNGDTMTTGPPPKPTALRLLHGGHPERINPREPVVRDAVPEPPESMSDEVRGIWDYTLRELVFMKIAAATDRDSLVCYCEAVVAHRKASAILAQSPVLIKGLHGGMVRNPALQIQRDSALTIRVFAQEFGLTPSARSRIQSEGPAVIEGHVNPFVALA
jgi:P27 family predicted phage terminase small subunit